MRVLVVGIGNDLRGDDGAGRVVAEAVQDRGLAGVTARWTQQLVPELAEHIADVDRVVFVDAAPGTTGVVVEELAPGPPEARGHQADPASLLGLLALTGLPVPEAFVVMVPAVEFGLSTRLSAMTRAALPAAVDAVTRLCRAPESAD